jgi:hypothetical protein
LYSPEVMTASAALSPGIIAAKHPALTGLRAVEIAG